MVKAEFKEYLKEVLESAESPDRLFPELLFNPICNDFGDIYFTQDPEDYDSEAIRVDPRFTRANLSKIRPKVKRLDRYLESLALYDDYMDYLVQKYGGKSLLQAAIDAGDFPDFLPQGRPELKKNSPYRRIIKQGIIPSIRPSDIDPVSVFDRAVEIFKAYPTEPMPGEPDYDEMVSMNAKMSKHDLKMLRDRNAMIARYNRVQNLYRGGGMGISPVKQGIEFIDHYYANVGATVVNSDLDKDDDMGLVDKAIQMEDRKYMTEGQLIEEKMIKSGNRYFQDTMLRDSIKEMENQFYIDLAEQVGIDVLGTMGKGMDKSRIKAIRAGIHSYDAKPMTKKERKKYKKKQRKLERARVQKNVAHNQLRNILLSNKIITDNRKHGPIRFEDMRF